MTLLHALHLLMNSPSSQAESRVPSTGAPPTWVADVGVLRRRVVAPDEYALHLGDGLGALSATIEVGAGWVEAARAVTCFGWIYLPSRRTGLRRWCWQGYQPRGT